jgi:2-methylisocitrate lyase-like PEP mutase family enzyme
MRFARPERPHMLQDAPAALRAMMRTNDLIWGPGVYDGLSARLAAAVGFPMLYMTGAGTTVSRLGQPDLGLMGLSEMAENARTIAGVSNVPVIADADTGYGGPVNVARTVKLYQQAGVAGLHIEDQEFPKRCGHLAGKVVVSIDEFSQRIRAAVNERAHPDFVIIARTDARQPNGFDDAMTRIKTAFALGADVGFLEGPASIEEAERVVREAPGPMLLNLATNGTTPNLRVDQVRSLGYRFAIWPTVSIVSAALAIRQALEALKREGTDEGVVAGLAPRDLFAMVGLDEALAIDQRSGSTTLAGV